MLTDISNILSYLMQSADLPLLTAFVLGLFVSLNPCQLAISTSALAYEYRSGKGLTEGIIYALGRTITYTLLGWITMCLVGGGKNIEGLKSMLAKAEELVPYALIAIGAFLLFRGIHHHTHKHDDCHNSRRIIKRNGPLGSLVLGMSLALAFCPESAIFYFGMMIPLSIKSQTGALVPLVFSISASIPVMTIAWIMKKAVKSAERFSSNFDIFQRVLNVCAGLLFIAIAILMLIHD